MTRRIASSCAWLVLLASMGCTLVGSPRTLRLSETGPGISAADLEAHVRALTDDHTEGRRTGSRGEAVASDYLIRAMREIGLEPAGTDGSYLHAFDFTAGIALGSGNRLVARRTGEAGRDVDIDTPFAVDRDWRPLAFSTSGEIEASRVVFAGYGLVAPAEGGQPALDDYAGLEVADRWVMVFRDVPPAFEGARRQQLQLHSSLRYKAMVARDLGARGVLFVSGPLGGFRHELAPLRFDASLAGTRIAVVSISDALAARLLAEKNLELEEVQRRAGVSLPHPVGFEIGNIELAGRIDLETLRATGHNVVGRLQVGTDPSDESIVLGAHFDHLGRGEGSSSLASGGDVGKIHPGADDNASGVAVLLEIAEQLAAERDRGLSLGQRDFVFAAWSGEELGLLGSTAWVAEHVHPHVRSGRVTAYLNFDMVGRLRDQLVVQGLGSSPQWAGLLESAAAPLALSISPQQDSYLPTDATSFYTVGIPVLSAFTGVHSEYHTPHDTRDRLNLVGAVSIAELASRIARGLSQAAQPPEYRAQKSPASGQIRSGFRVFLGTVPDYAQSDVVGVRLTGVAPAGPAEKAGIRGGDIIVEVDGRPIENLYDYTYALESLRVAQPARIVVLRDDERISLEVVPGSRD